ncbi:MAG: TetR/AcrR family transcriptional regulator [Sphingomonadales bacterium]|nr:TetR/AcrR family transcriptional regulator [Sphingomonadales bacterium]
MASTTRRVGTEGSATRALILDTAEAVIREEGYAAASTRRVATRAGLKPSLVHYYFPTTDDLLLAVNLKGAEASARAIDAALAADDPVRALWLMHADSARNALAYEFIALANHRKNLRAVIAEHSERMRARQVEVLSRLFGDRLAAEGLTPAGLSVVLAGIGRVLATEDALGITAGHDDARAFVEHWLERLAQNQGTKV